MTITNSDLNSYPSTSAFVPVDNLHARRGKTRPIMRIAQVACAVLALFGIAAATGAAYEEIANANDLSAHGMTGRLVDVGGYRLHLDCRGYRPVIDRSYPLELAAEAHAYVDTGRKRGNVVLSV